MRLITIVAVAALSLAATACASTMEPRVADGTPNSTTDLQAPAAGASPTTADGTRYDPATMSGSGANTGTAGGSGPGGTQAPTR